MDDYGLEQDKLWEEHERNRHSHAQILEINGMVGALDGNTMGHVRKILHIINLQSWAIGRLKTLCGHSNREYAENKSLEILEELKKRIDEEHASLVDVKADPSGRGR